MKPIKTDLITIILIVLIVTVNIINIIIQHKINFFSKQIEQSKISITTLDKENKILYTEFSKRTSINEINKIAKKYFPNFTNITKHNSIKLSDVPININLK